MPPHRIYIETHLGGGAVLRHKKPAEENIGIDRDPAAIAAFRKFPSNYRFLVADASEFLNATSFSGDELVYADPPYPAVSRRDPKIYRYEYSDSDHHQLLEVLKKLPCRVMISSYPNNLYDGALRDWEKVEFWGTSHVGRRRECVWMNYTPTLLHDTRFIGGDFRGRQSWKRKHQRWVERFTKLPVAEQQCLLDDLMKIFRNSPISPCT